MMGASGGLGYRIFSFALGLRLSRLLKRELVFSWLNSPECAADFEDLFEPYENIKIVNTRIDERKVPILNYGNVVYPSRKIQNLLYRTFWKKKEPELIGYIRKLKPRKVFLDKIKTFSESNFDSHTVSIHLRRTDLPSWISKNMPSNIEVIRMLRAYASKNRGTKFFLATDSKKTEKMLVAALGGRVITYPKNEWVAKHDSEKDWARNIYRSRASLEDSLVELYLLSNTRRFLRFNVYCGNFNVLASLLNPKQKIITLDYKRKTA